MIDPKERFSLLQDIRRNSRRLDVQEIQSAVQNDPSMLDQLQAALNPTERARLFPDYYKDQVPVNTGLAQATGMWDRIKGAAGQAVDRIFNPAKAIYESVPAGSGSSGGSTPATPAGSEPMYSPDAKFEEPDLKTREGRMKGVYNSFRKAGMTDAWARAMTAEVGRENDFRSDIMFGVHDDPHNKAKNLGMISMQGSRYRGLKQHLAEKGLLTETGGIVQSQAGLDAMAEYMMHEIQTDGSYKKTKAAMEKNPEIDPENAAYMLGKDYIRWRIDDPRYAHHINKRRDYYNQISGYVEAEKKNVAGTPESTDETATAEAVPQSGNTPSIAPPVDENGVPQPVGPTAEPVLSGGGKKGTADEILAQAATGKIDPGAGIVQEAMKWKGMHEQRDRRALQQFLGGRSPVGSSNAWCAGFVNSVLETQGIKGTNSWAAGSFSDYGQAVTNPEEVKAGDIVVNRKKSPRTGMVGSHVMIATGPAYMGKDGRMYIPTISGNTNSGKGTEGDQVGTYPVPFDTHNVRKIPLEEKYYTAEGWQRVQSQVAAAKQQQEIAAKQQQSPDVTQTDSTPTQSVSQTPQRSVGSDLPPAQTGEMIQREPLPASVPDQPVPIRKAQTVQQAQQAQQAQTEPVRRQEPSIKPASQDPANKLPDQQPVAAPAVTQQNQQPQQVSTAPQNVLKTEAHRRGDPGGRQVQSDVQRADASLNSQMPQQVHARASAPKSYVDAVKRSSGHGPERGYWNPIGGPALVG